VIGYDKTAGKLFVDRTHSGRVDFNKNFPARTEAPLKLTDRNLQLHLLVDRNSVEVFANNGQVTMTNLFFPPAGLINVKTYAKVSPGARLDLWKLKSTHLENSMK
jgi:sucrose-6-phosphate hydrolase SacC (GH32 family)